MVLTRLSPCVIILCLLSGCNIFDNTAPDHVFNPDDTIELRMWEDLAADVFEFQMHAVESPFCENTVISYSARHVAQTLQLSVSQVDHGSPCEYSEVPVRTHSPFTLSTDTYRVEVHLGNSLQNIGTLTVSDDRYVLDMDAPAGLFIPFNVLHKIPEHVTWGSFNSTVPIPDLVADFKAQLTLLGPEANIPSGQYGYFSIEPPNDLQIGNSDPAMYQYNFIHLLEQDTSELEILVESFRGLLGEGQSLTCTTWQGIIL